MTDRMREMFLAEVDKERSIVQKTIDEQKETIEKYKNVGKTLAEYVKKLETPISAKICDVAYFCDAHVVRTNEVMVNLGDDYLVECSSHTATKIIQRRIADCQKTIDNGNEFIKMLDEKVEYTDKLFGEPKNKDEVEICEPYDEEKEEEFYKNRKIRNESKKSSEVSHDEAMKRLEELEKLELENNEIEQKSEENIEKEIVIQNTNEVEFQETKEDGENDGEEEEEEEYDEKENYMRMLKMPGVNEKDLEKLLQFLETCDGSSSEEEEDDDDIYEGDEENALDSDDYENNEIEEKKTEKSVEIIEKIVTSTVEKTTKKKKSLKFAKDLEKIKLFRQTDTIETDKSTPEIETKSILKVKDPTPIAPGALSTNIEKKEITVMSECSFPGKIFERTDPIYSMPSTSKDEPEIPAKISKFRQRRAAR
ncbi:unnamed protein product [Caenorhabditis angaria]|uniref:Uncharacterized protein n=1 Tax=Caenorhabditis angaria TaxID=860376 RepID=A0A9P1I916_9PELO|nr:unnamed protein product [Caenorhabditis angaria]